MGAFLGLERNQVLYSPLTGNYYFVASAQRIAGGQTLRVVGKKIDVTSSVMPLVAHAVAGHLRRIAKSSVFDARGYRVLLDAARNVERKAKIDNDQ